MPGRLRGCRCDVHRRLLRALAADLQPSLPFLHTSPWHAPRSPLPASLVVPAIFPTTTIHFIRCTAIFTFQRWLNAEKELVLTYAEPTSATRLPQYTGKRAGMHALNGS